MKNLKLIILYGFAASGKSTLAAQYINKNPLMLAVEGDEIIEMMGLWKNDEKKAREMVFEHTKSMTENQLNAGYDVLLPYLLTDSAQAEAFEAISKKYNASFHEVYLKLEKEEAVERLLQRGFWERAESNELTQKDLPDIENLYEIMQLAMNEREDVKIIPSKYGEISETYTAFLEAVG